MKIIVLTDANEEEYEELANELNKEDTILFGTHCEKGDRYEYGALDLFIDTFLQMPSKNFALVGYSGNLEVSRLMGDECSDMIVVLDYDEDSPNYMKKPVEVLRDVIKMTKNFKGQEGLIYAVTT